jgi:hypothetical protein
VQHVSELLKRIKLPRRCIGPSLGEVGEGE